MRRALVGAFVCTAMTALAAAAAPARAAAPCVTLEYLALLGRAENALTAAPPQVPAALTAVTEAEDLAPASASELAPVIAGLTASPPDVTASLKRVGLVVSTLALPPGSACNVDSPTAENVLHQVYRSSVFADLDQNQPPSVFERIGAAINWILSHLFGLLGTGGSILLGVLVLIALAGFVIYRLRGVAGGRRALASTEPASVGDDPEREWQLGLDAARRGDHREAIRRAFRAALLDVADRRIPLDRAWTTREMLATMSVEADLLAVVAPAAAAFDKAWYGRAPVGAADWDIARDRCEAVRKVARRAAGAQAP